MNRPNCRDCAFYEIETQFKRASYTDEELHPADFNAECHRFPPIMEVPYEKLPAAAEPTHAWIWPLVTAVSWCGEWKPRR
jgi:hypothetical protein